MDGRDLAARLENFLAVADTRLTRLGAEDLADEVLDRLREILDADTAAVLLHQEGTDHLVARAARGLEEEVRQGVRVPIGSGFAGNIADTRRPVRLDRVDPSTVTNRVLWEKGIQRMLGVPLLRGDDLLGVLHVGRLAPRDFDAEDEALLQLAAERVSSAVQNQRYAVESAAADLLERGLLPPRLPAVDGIEFASRYVPTENRTIGGDWYDAFVGPDGALWVVTGDVAGHGLRAAVVMGRVKSALRAYALLGDGPARVLELTDRKVVHFEMGAMITVVCARSVAPFEQWTISSAGHLPPVSADPGHPAEFADIHTDPPLGAQPGCHRSEVTVPLAAGGLLVLYTDGLIERRDEALATGLARLRSAVSLAHPDTTCRLMMRELVGSGSPVDDIAILALRRAGPADADPASCARTFEPQPHAPRDARRFALDAAGQLATSARHKLELLVSELATNAVTHAGTPFEVAVRRSGCTVLVKVSDNGDSGITLHQPEPTDVHGRGLPIVAALAGDWGVIDSRATPGKTVWFSLDAPDDSPARYPPTQGTAMSTDPDRPILRPEGDVDMLTAESLQAQGERLLAAGGAGTCLVVDLGAVAFLDSAGLNTLVRLRLDAIEAGGDVVLRNVPERIATLLQVTGLSELFTRQ